MTSLFRPKGQSVSSSAPIITSLRVQTAALGRPIPRGYGKGRVSANVIWYGDLAAIAHTTTTTTGGKGGGGGGNTTSETTYTYTAATLLAMGRGPIAGVSRVWQDKQKTSLAALGLSLYLGDASQTAFPHLVTNHPSEALAYRGVAYVAHAALDLGENASLANHNFEVAWALQRGSTGQTPKAFTANAATDELTASAHGYTTGQIVRVSSAGTLPAPLAAGADYYVVSPAANTLKVAIEPNGTPVDLTDTGSGVHSLVRWIADADPRDVVNDLLLAAGVDPARIGDLSAFSNYCVANGIFISPVYTEQRPTSELVKEIAAIGNAEPVYSEDKIKLVPYSDAAATGNGVTFTPNTTPVFEFDDNDFLTDGDEPPVEIDDDEPSEAYNVIKAKFHNRERDYNEDVVEAQDDDHIALYGRKVMDEPIELYGISDPAVARFVVQIILQNKLYFRCGYRFRLPPGKADLLEPMDFIAITDARLGLSAFPVRITKIEENDGEKQEGFAFHVREFPAGVSSSAIYPAQLGAGFAADFNAAPGNTGTPAIFDAPADLAPSGYEAWVAASGASALWGGCQVWVATDSGGPFKQVGLISGRSRHGVLSASFPVGSDPDVVNTCQVDLTVARGDLTGGTQADADAENTLSHINGELIAFQDATLTAPYSYDLETYVRRGLRGTLIKTHAINTPFVRCDQAIFRYAYDPGLVGQAIYVKLPAFNVFGGGQQSLAEASVHSFAIQGPIGAPATVTGFSAQIDAGVIKLAWSPVPAGFDYEIRVGASFDTGAVVQRVQATSLRLPPVASGSYTYWIKARSVSGQYALIAASAVVVVSNPASVAPVAVIDAANIKLNWDAPGSSFPIRVYEIRYGATFAGGTSVGFVDVTTFQTPIDWAGGRKWWVIAIDVAGNEGAPAFAELVVTPPSQPAVLAEVIDNNVLLRWTDARQTLPLRHYEVRRGAVFASAEIIGTISAEFTVVFESTAGTYRYWVVGVDAAGNYGTEGSISSSVSAPPDYILFENLLSDFSGTKSNARTVERSGFVLLPGISGNFADTPDAAANSITGDIDLRARIAAVDYTAALEQDVISKWHTTGNNRSYILRITAAGELAILWSPDGTASNQVTSTAALNLAGGVIKSVRATLDVDNGAAGNSARFYTSDDGINWSQLGTTVTTVGVASIFNSTAVLALGARQGGTAGLFAGRIYLAQVFSGIAGTLAAEFDAMRTHDGDASFTSDTGEVWTVNAAGTPPARITSTGQRLLAMFDPSRTFQQHFTDEGWDQPQDQIDAGFPIYIQPGKTTGQYVEEIDYGTTLPATKITVDVGKTVVSGSTTITPTISVKLNPGDAWTNFVGQWSVYSTNFRYVKITLDFAGAGRDDLVYIDTLTTRLDVKLKGDAGAINANSGDAGGTTVNFNVAFIDIHSINATAQGTTPAICVVDFADVPNPISFKVLVFDPATGARLTRTARWEAKGV